MMRSSLNRRWELWRWNLFKWLFKLVDLIRLIMKLNTLDVHLIIYLYIHQRLDIIQWG